MASNRPQDTPTDEGFNLCLEIIKEITDLDVAIRSFIDNKSTFTPAQAKQLNSVANELLAGVAEHLPQFQNNLADLKKDLSAQESKKVPKEFESTKKDLLKGLKELYSKTSEAYTRLESVYKKTLKIHKDTEAKLEKTLKSYTAAPSTLFSGKDHVVEAKQSLRLKK